MFSTDIQEFENYAIYRDRKSTRLNSSHANISYAVFCLKKKKRKETEVRQEQEEEIQQKSVHGRTIELPATEYKKRLRGERELSLELQSDRGIWTYTEQR